MILRDAKAIARRWVEQEAVRLPGFRGAFFHGSVNWLPDDAELSASSDLDVMIALDGAEPPEKPGKFIHEGVLLEISYLSIDHIRTADQILGQYNLAGSFRGAGVIADPGGHLTALQRAVGGQYAKREWVHRRCEDARTNALRHLQSLSESAPFHDQVTSWLFGTGVTTHMLLVAGLKNPTVRKRYLAARELLAEYGRIDFYEPLLDLLGCGEMTARQAQSHLTTLEDAFDAAKTVIKTPVFFASDISDLARPIAIDGSRELIDTGFHREAIFWLAATYARCQKVLFHDAPAELRAEHEPGFRLLLADLGIDSYADLEHRSRKVEAFLPAVWRVAEQIISENPEIKE